jgi:2',3'-cyclic-nucleotide 2'-phosphodiesterase/3'-nucleotidase
LCKFGHTDEDENDYCDVCEMYLIVVVDFYAVNDLHGKFCDNADQPGVDEIGTYLELMSKTDDHTVLLSSGDMWQGSAESVLTNGAIMVDWMNALGFVAMTLGNHEFDWGEEPIRDNAEIADFPFLALNVYNYSTGKLADYCTPSVMIERGGLKIGIIGAIGDCYSSISPDMVEDVYFKVGSELTALVKAEALKLKGNGADLIVYSIHDDTNGGYTNYDTTLSGSYVDVVFEGHSHQAYVKNDAGGVVHIQGGGENKGLSHVEITVNALTGEKRVTEKEVVYNNEYKNLDDHMPTEEIEDKYNDIIDFAYTVLGTVSRNYNSGAIADYVAALYLEAGIEKWGNEYDVVYGGGFLKTRDPYNLYAGEKTYADLLSLLPFNNKLVLCKISGSNLKNKLIETTNSSYHGAVKSGFNSSSINLNGVYYVIVDMYTAQYKNNNLTIVEYYDETTYARDLLAEAIKSGELDGGTTVVKPSEDYPISSISSALSIGESLAIGKETTEYLYYKGTISNISSPEYGNCYLTDENGNTIFVYGLKDENGTRYDGMVNQPVDGDVVIIRSVIKKYQYPKTGEVVVELINSVVVAINP